MGSTSSPNRAGGSSAAACIVTLGRMETKGLVSSALDWRPGEGPPRRLYSPTRLGLKALVASRLLEGDLPLGRLRHATTD